MKSDTVVDPGGLGLDPPYGEYFDNFVLNLGKNENTDYLNLTLFSNF